MYYDLDVHGQLAIWSDIPVGMRQLVCSYV
jgi:hypothetical protein